MSRVELRFSGRKLKNMDGFMDKSDPIVQVYIKQANGGLQFVGQTERIDDNLNPDWATSVIVDYFFEVEQMITCRVLDVDDDKITFKDADFIGETVFPLAKLVSSKGQKLVETLKVPNKNAGLRGILTIRGEFQEVSNDLAHITFRAEGLPKRSRNACCLPKRPFPAIVLRRVREDGEWVKVFETENKKRTTDAEWAPCVVPVARLCNGDVDRPVRVEIVDKRSGNECPPVIACMETTLRSLEESDGRLLQLEDPCGKDRLCGNLMSTVRIESQPTFIDYIRGGMQLNLVIGIDFTESNGSPLNPGSLHYALDRHKPNEYERAISSVCGILENYDSDRMYPVYGFGAKPSPNSGVSHCFPLGPNGNEVHGLEGILDVYKESLQKVKFSGPTLFAPLINTLISEVQASMVSGKDDPYSHYVMLILTDGVIHDMKQTMDAVVESSYLPISIIIVGVGEASFEAMDALDADSERLVSRSGKVQQQDNLQFVPFREMGGSGEKLAREVLRELPEQVVTHFHTHRHLQPRPPANASAGLGSKSSLLDTLRHQPSGSLRNNTGIASAPPITVCDNAVVVNGLPVHEPAEYPSKQHLLAGSPKHMNL